MKNPNPIVNKIPVTSNLPACWRNLRAFVVAVAVTYLTAAILVSQWNIASIVALGLPVSLAERGLAATHDIGHMAGSYLPLIAVALVIALPVAWLLSARVFKRSAASSYTELSSSTSTKPSRYAVTEAVLYPLAGFVAVACIHIALKLAFDVSAVAPTRTIGGLLGQAMAGALGGYTFYRLSNVASTAASTHA